MEDKKKNRVFQKLNPKQKKEYTIGKVYTNKRKTKHINLSERIKIEAGLAKGQSLLKIATELGRSISERPQIINNRERI